MFSKGRKVGAIAAVLVIVLTFAGIVTANTPAGTQISNQATATYQADGKARTSASNIVYVTVQQVYDVEVGPSTAINRNVVEGQKVQHVYTVTNTGNGTDTFSVETVIAPDGFVDESAVKWFHDKDGNGVINSGDPEVSSITLAAGASANIIAEFMVPQPADPSVTLVLLLKASSGGGANGTSEEVTFNIVDEDVVIASLTGTPAEVVRGDTITYTVNVINVGTNDTNVEVGILVPPNTTFVENSLWVQGDDQEGDTLPPTVTLADGSLPRYR